ncbi:MAG: KUP/HAK/KT family potassium transporter, partial [Cyclobacteriaceae bacterium]
MESHSRKHALSTAGVLVSLGIIYGDIGTSPIYTFRFIVGNNPVSEELVYGGLSCVFWTLTIITSIKYIYLALSADNKGEGGIFALYALVRRYKASWVIFPAIIGCCTLIADGFITPAMSVTSAVEGLKSLVPSISTNTIITIVIIILVALFIFQQFGSSVVGKTFGPVMLVWFIFIGAIGAYHLSFNWSVLEALNPVYGMNLLIKYQGGFWILGAIFLCTTGAEAMYSDLGHCGKSNIRLGWGFVKFCLLLSYFGQGAWLLNEYKGQQLGETIPFFGMIPQSLLIFGVIIATMATII